MSSKTGGTSRRRFLGTAAGVIGGAAGMSLLPPSLQQAMALPAPKGGLRAIEHVVFLMQENRSFDHYYGTLRGVRGFADRNAVELADGSPVYAQPDGHGGRVLPFSVREAAAGAGKDVQWVGALAHGWPDGQAAHAGGRTDGWVPAKSAATMAHYDRQDIPFQYELADTFTICDAYHCSVFSSTSPNRNYHFSGHTGYEPGTSQRAVTNAAYHEDTHPGYTWTTAAELLGQAGVSWRAYQEMDNYEDNNLEFFATFKAVARKALQGDFLSLDSFYSALGAASPDRQQAMLARLAEGVAALTPAERDLYDRALHRVMPGTLAAEFRADVAAGKLPAVSWIVPSAAESEHPSASSPIQSANLVYDILDALGSNPEVWQKTALFLTFDENDGLFDHVPPPVPPAAFADDFADGKPIGLGFRVPMIVVSPWTVGGYVNSQVFDHSSTVRFLEEWAGVKAPDITPWRRTVAGDLTSVFDFHRGRRMPELTEPAPVPAFTGRWRPAPPADQRMPAVEEGRRPARPLPYQPDADLRADGTGLTLALRNGGPASAHFQLWSYAGEFDAPRHYDVLGEEHDAVPSAGAPYRLTLLGPNGFRREFAGSATGAAAHADVTTTVDGHSRKVTLTLANRGTAPLTFTVTATAYDTGRRTAIVRPGGQRTVHWHAGHGEGWYDLAVTVAQDAAFHRRLAGHIENGRESVSG